jgi:hypothetical protein
MRREHVRSLRWTASTDCVGPSAPSPRATASTRSLAPAWNTVLLIHIAQAGTHQLERDYTADEAGHLAADLLEYAASDTVDAHGDDDRHEIGSVKITGTDSIPPTSVRSLFPLVELHEQGGLGIEYTPGSAHGRVAQASHGVWSRR